MKTVGRVLASLSATGLLMAGLILAASLIGGGLSGRSAEQTFVAKDVTADILPPPMYLIEMRLVLSEVTEGTVTLEEAQREVSRLEKEYLARVDYWTKNPPYGLEKHLLGQEHETALQFIASAKLALTAATSNDPKAARTALTDAHGSFLKHRAAVDETVKVSTDFANSTITQFQNTIRNATYAQLGVFLIAALVLCALWYWVNRRVSVPIQQAVRVAETVATGDLRTQLVPTRQDETGKLLSALARMNQNLQGIVNEVRQGCDSIATGSQEIAGGNSDLSQRTEAQASTLQQTSASMELLNAAVTNNAANARKASEMAVSASEAVTRGRAVVNNVVTTMDDITHASQQISDIIGVIDSIAFQTNILALNAAVEAARAGDQGRGFAVVASEVRSLAKRSADAAREIKTLISNSVEKVGTGTRLVADAGQTMADIVTQVQGVSDLIGEISTSSQEQTKGIAQVSSAVTQLDQNTQQNAALVEQTAAAAGSLSRMSQKLVTVVSVFKM